MTRFTESDVEEAALAWLEGAGWTVVHGPEIAPDAPGAERDDFGEVVLAMRLRNALVRLNPGVPVEALDDAYRKLTRPEGAELLPRNRTLHRLLVDGVTVEYRTPDGSIRGARPASSPRRRRRTRAASRRAANPVTGASAWSGTRRARGRA